MIKFDHDGDSGGRKVIGIWQWMSDLAIDAQLKNWELEICFNQEKVYVLRPKGSENPIEQVVTSIPGNTNKIIEEEQNSLWYTTIPIFLKEKSVFYWKLESFEKIEIQVLLKWQADLELRVRDESRLFGRYPTFIPFIMPFDENVFYINKAITQKQKYFFLNGQAGTGKHVFIQNFLQYHYQETSFADQFDRSVSLYKFTFQGPDKVSGIIVHELGLLDSKEISYLEKAIEDNSCDIIFICSAYDPEILLNSEIITIRIYDILMENRILFSSVQRRISSVIAAIKYYVSLKIDKEPEFLHEDWVKINASKYSFADILTIIQESTQPVGAISALIDTGESLRDIVAKVEYDAIYYAQKVVGNSQNKIAKLLGISRGSLQHKLKKYNFPYHEWEE